MSRALKQGLDYFPLKADFATTPTVCLIKKTEGDAATDILIQALCVVYTVEGYFATVDDWFYDKISIGLYHTDTDTVRRVVRLAARLGMFHEGLLREKGVLTSFEIQQQFLFCARKRRSIDIRPDLLLLSQEEIQVALGRSNIKVKSSILTENEAQKPEEQEDAPKSEKTANVQNGAIYPQSKVKYSIENNLPPQSSPVGRTEERGAEEAALGAAGGGDLSLEAGGDLSLKAAGGSHPRGGRVWTQDDIDAMRPPGDGKDRNLDGLRRALRQFGVVPAEQRAIIALSDYGVIGAPVWQAIYQMRVTNWSPKMPGRYLLSAIHKARRGE
jgi:hypothetical protein